jgi:uncharacterized protein YkwD
MQRLPEAAVAASLLLAAAACAPTEPAPGGVPRISAADADAIRLRHLDAVNAVRIQEGLQPLALSAELNAAADTHAGDMSVQKRAWHFGSDLTSWRERAFRAGYRGEVLGENIFEGADGDLTVLRYWLEVPDTRRVILAPAGRGLGLGWHQDPGGKLWWVQLVGT